MSKIIKYIPILLFFSSFFSFAAETKYSFRHLKIEDGLSQTTIGAIIQDSQGFMWFGTGNGLNKYDGYNVTVFNNIPEDSSSISADGVLAFYEDAEKYLWIGTTDGVLNRYNRASETFSRFDIANNVSVNFERDIDFYEYPISFSRNNNSSITSIAEDKEGILWIGTWGKGLFSFNKKTGEKKHYYYKKGEENSLSFNRIMKVFVDSRGAVWVGTFGGGLNKVVKKGGDISFIHYKHAARNKRSLRDNKVITIYEDRSGSLWVGTYEGGLNKLTASNKSLNPAEAVFKNYSHNALDDSSLSHNTVMAIVESRDGSLWIGTFGGGLNKFNISTETFEHFMHDPLNEKTLGDNDVLSLYVDASGILWAGTHLAEGISIMETSSSKFSLIAAVHSEKNTLSDNVVWAFEEDFRNNIWIATYRGGLNYYNRKLKSFKHYPAAANKPGALSDNHIRSLRLDKFGNLWIGAYSGGLNLLKKNSDSFVTFKHNPADPASIGANQIQTILIDDTTVWLGTFGSGLNRLHTSADVSAGKVKFTRFEYDPSDKNSLSDDRVYSLYKTKDGVLWVGTFGSGLHKAEPEGDLSVTKKIKFTQYANNPSNAASLSDNRVMTIFEDSNGALWIGTYGGGLNKFDRNAGTFKRYSEKNGLKSGVVYGLLEDDNKNLWMSTDNGIYKLSLESELFTHYDLKDGLQSLEFSGGAYYKTTSGEMFFGGINGINYFHPDSIKENTYVPPIVITSLKVMNKPVKGEPDQLVLEFDQNFISFEFAALDFTNPMDNHFAYRLEGLEENWQYADGTRRVTSYTNLSPGEYTFKVKGSNNDDVWNTEGASLKIIILPPLWQRWWFIAMGVLLIGGMLYYISTVRIKNLLAIEKLKSKLAADLHDNVGSGLTEISILSELAAQRIQHNSNPAPDELRTISETARKLIDNMSDIVWVVNPKRDTLYDLILRLKDNYSEILSSMGISFKTANLEKLKDVKLPMDFRQHLYLMFKEAINNSVKHSRCTRLSLDVNIRGSVLEIILEDNGIGSADKDPGFGNGIKNMETRAILIGGKLNWESSPSLGTRIHFTGRLDSLNKMRRLLGKNDFI